MIQFYRGLIRFSYCYWCRADTFTTEINKNLDASMWEETSGTGMFAYAMIVGVKKGWLDKDGYGPAARKAWIVLTSYVNQMGGEQ